MDKVLPVTQARKELLQLVDEVDEKLTRVDITKHGKVKAVLVSPEFINSYEETLYSLEHSLKDIRESEKEFARGEYVTMEEFKKDLAEREKKPKKNAR